MASSTDSTKQGEFGPGRTQGHAQGRKMIVVDLIFIMAAMPTSTKRSDILYGLGHGMASSTSSRAKEGDGGLHIHHGCYVNIYKAINRKDLPHIMRNSSPHVELYANVDLKNR
jgi:hypothetical protein